MTKKDILWAEKHPFLAQDEPTHNNFIFFVVCYS